MMVCMRVTGVTLKRSGYAQHTSGLTDRLAVESEKRRGIKVTPRLLIRASGWKVVQFTEMGRVG